MKWNRKNVLVTGGASFIGSHLVEKLLSLGANVRVADDLSSGRLRNLEKVSKEIEFFKGDLRDIHFTKKIIGSQTEIVFHLAASHGGRGYIDTHPAECCSNMALDQIVFQAAHETGVDRICYASSACVYPTFLQSQSKARSLKEEDADPFTPRKAFADLEYGWAKLMGEMSLRAYHREYGMKASSLRIFTAYGQRENESHAVIALIAKAFIEMDPYEIWGSGKQARNFTYVGDIVDAMVLACEKIEDGTPINAGTDRSVTINEIAEMIFDIVSWKPKKIHYDTTKPLGVFNRVADLTRAKNMLSWEPRFTIEQGLRKTIDWYFSTNKKENVKKNLNQLLFERLNYGSKGDD